MRKLAREIAHTFGCATCVAGSAILAYLMADEIRLGRVTQDQWPTAVLVFVWFIAAFYCGIRCGFFEGRQSPPLRDSRGRFVGRK